MNSRVVLAKAFALSSLLIMTPSAFAAPISCKAVLVDRKQVESDVQWKNDRSYLQALQRKETLGSVKSFYHETLQTQFYFTATGHPNAKGQIPLVDEKAKKVFLFIHGSGTMKSSGRNYLVNMNVLANIGLSGVAVDLPFHANGPKGEEFQKSPHFMNWLRSIVLELKKYGKPVVLAGHSFGPDVILEYVTRFPRDVNEVGAWNPAGFTKELDHWYENYTENMKFGGDVAENVAGGEWAGNMSHQFAWNKGQLPDPTKVNPNLRIRILSGNREEYVPAPVDPVTFLPVGDNTYDISVPLKKIFFRAEVVIEPGVGHYIFDHVDKEGLHVITREMMVLAGLDPKKQREYQEEVRRQFDILMPSEKVALKYAQDPLFQAWADLNYGKGTIVRLTAQQKDTLAKRIYDQFFFDQKRRDEEIFQKILNSKNTDPEFYAAYQKQIDALNPKRVDNGLFPHYLNYLNKKAEEAATVEAAPAVTTAAPAAVVR
ncbi:MAG: hypothetical protein ACK5Y2_11495 [Bdellovibrionales bacterium]